LGMRQQIQYFHNSKKYKEDNTPWYVPNITLHEDFNVLLVKEVIKQRSTKYHNKIEGHVNVLIRPLLEPHNERRLKRNWPADLSEG
jgi:ribosomal protein S17E